MSDSQDPIALITRKAGALIKSEPRGLPQIYLAQHKETERSLPEVYLSDHENHSITGRLKWMASTCLAGTVGLCLIGIAVYASMSMEDGTGMMDSIKRASLAALRPMETASIAHDSDQSPTALKGDRIETNSAGFASRQLIHETVVQRQGSREFITIKPYVRLVVGLSTEQPAHPEDIPPFNPFKLYSDNTPIGGDGDAENQKRFTSKVVNLPMDSLSNDGLELGPDEVLSLVAEAAENFAYAERSIDASEKTADAADDLPVQKASYRPNQPVTSLADQNLTIINKVVEDEDDGKPKLLPGTEVKAIEVKSGDSLLAIIKKAGADMSQASAIIAAMKPVFSPDTLQPKQEIRFTLVPTPSDTGAMDAVRVSVFSADDEHLATVARSMDGDYLASDQAVDIAAIEAMKKEQEEEADPSKVTLYKAFYEAAREQDIPANAIRRLLRIHSYDVDFKQKVRPGDTFEAFFDLPDGAGENDQAGGELLYTSMTVRNETRIFYRFRTPDGVVDYYDTSGNSAKKFLMRNPVRGGRYTSGYGYRRHPLLGGTRMHTGVDWAAPRGTPIVAAGDGTVQSVGRNGAYGNYVRISHSNGFDTAYGHMSKFADGMHTGVHVKQGQVIGFVGSTGRSTGPHCHFEVLVNNDFVDPMTIQVPRGLQLTGRQLAEFQKERTRIDNLMQIDPITTRVADVNP
ncbi:M23 family metallopeptidase [Methyloligella solikamskensis]|uniref:Peptidoglycan DD-metalloendopeptidase family protein n=1 Tax=Methyloligella solikamskensis TaxID=1177756 RepID=A0ABW3J7V2_9HYPH